MRFPLFRDNWTKYRVSDLLETYPTNSLSWDQLSYDISKLKNIHYGLIHNGFETTCIDVKSDLIPYIKLAYYPKKYTLLKIGDLILADASEDREDVGKSIEIIEEVKQKTISGLHTIHARDKVNFIIKGFKGFYFKSKPMKEQIFKIANGSKIYGITSSNFNELYMCMPGKLEQEKIVSLMMKIEQRIQTQSKIIDDYLYLKESIIQHIFNNNYHSVPLNDLIKESSLRNKNLSFNNILSVNNSLGFIKQTEQFEERKVASTNTSNYKIVKKNQYAYNPARINVGSIARLKNFDIGIVSPMYIIFELNTTRITYTYFDIFLQSTTFKKQLLKKLEGSVRQCLTFSGMQNMSIKLPSIDVQIQLSKKIKNIDLKILIEKKYLEQLRNQKKYLLRNMFI